MWQPVTLTQCSNACHPMPSTRLWASWLHGGPVTWTEAGGRFQGINFGPHRSHTLKWPPRILACTVNCPAAVWLSSRVSWTTTNWDRNCSGLWTHLLASVFPAGFKPLPLVVVRTLKAEIVSGLEMEKAAWAQGQDAELMVSGSYGVVQFCNDIAGCKKN